MFKYRQSSLIAVAERSPPYGGNAPPPACRCMQLAENLSAARTPCQFPGGCGGRKRKSPTGGAANGTPLKTRTSTNAPEVPVISPFSTRIGSEIAATADAAVRRMASAAAVRVNVFSMARMIYPADPEVHRLTTEP